MGPLRDILGLDGTAEAGVVTDHAAVQIDHPVSGMEDREAGAAPHFNSDEPHPVRETRNPLCGQPIMRILT